MTPDLAGVMNFEDLGNNSAKDFPAKDELTSNRVRIEKAAAFLERKAAFGFEVFGDGIADFVVLKIHMAAAAFAHGGLRADRDVQIGAALKTADASGFLGSGRARLWDLGRGRQSLLDAKVLPALFANTGVSGRGFLLLMSALRAWHGYFFGLH